MTQPKRIMISGAISNDPNYREKFAAAEAKNKARGYIVMNPAVLPMGFDYNDYLEITFAMQDACDGMYMLKDFRESHGAMLEFKRAVENRMEIIYEEDE